MAPQNPCHVPAEMAIFLAHVQVQPWGQAYSEEGKLPVKLRALDVQPPWGLAQDTLNVMGQMDGWNDEAGLGRLFLSLVLPGGRYWPPPRKLWAVPWAGACTGPAPTSMGGCLSHCLGIF